MFFIQIEIDDFNNQVTIVELIIWLYFLFLILLILMLSLNSEDDSAVYVASN